MKVVTLDAKVVLFLTVKVGIILFGSGNFPLCEEQTGQDRPVRPVGLGIRHMGGLVMSMDWLCL